MRVSAGDARLMPANGGIVRAIDLTRRARFVMRVWVLTSLCAGSLAVASPAVAGAYDPGPVTNITATSGPGTLTISWSPANPGTSYSGTPYTIVGYTVRATSPGLSGTVASCTAQITTCTLTGLENGRPYYIQVTARNSFYGESNVWGAGPWTPCCSAPAAPGNVTATATSEAASLTWSAPSNSGATGGVPITYVVTSNPPGAGCTTNALTCGFSGLVNGTAYTFNVVAQTQYGSSAPGRSAAVTPLGLPGAPAGVVGYVGSKGSVNVTWVGPTVTGGTPVVEYIATATPGGAVCTSTGELNCTITGLSNGTAYTFTVVARNAVGPGPASPPSAVARVLAGPGMPRTITARAGRGVATVSWKPPASTGGLKISKYVVTASPSGKTCSTKKTICTFSGLTDNTVYVFSVRAYNAKGAGLPGQSRAVRTDPTPPKPEVQVG